ncbi:hypothetical protein MesoLjLb_17720 [Mesorhizobium sp. L-8-3]|nr:hypothetical protein MesoLjLb_17720 [Mesorhizobium sp. L-8-3]
MGRGEAMARSSEKSTRESPVTGARVNPGAQTDADTDLIECALANVALEDDFAEIFRSS